MVCEAKAGEARLIDRLADEDPAVRRELFWKYNRAMRRRAKRVLRNGAEVEDAVQDAWLAVLTRIRSFSGRSGLLTWIVAVTQNCDAAQRIRLHRGRSRLRRALGPGVLTESVGPPFRPVG